MSDKILTFNPKEGDDEVSFNGPVVNVNSPYGEEEGVKFFDPLYHIEVRPVQGGDREWKELLEWMLDSGHSAQFFKDAIRGHTTHLIEQSVRRDPNPMQLDRLRRVIDKLDQLR